MSKKKNKAEEIFTSGFTCSQSVFAIFAEKAGVPVDTALKNCGRFRGRHGTNGQNLQSCHRRVHGNRQHMGNDAVQLIGAGEAIAALGVPTIQTPGFFIIATASTVFSIILLQNGRLPKIAGITGIFGFVITFLDILSTVFLPIAKQYPW